MSASPQLPASWNREQLAWAAGLVDGEGWFGINHNKPQKTGVRVYGHPTLSVAQCDRRVLDKLQNALAIGKVGGPYKKKTEHHNDFYLFYVNTFERLQHSTALLWTWLSPVKRAQAAKALCTYIEMSQRPRLRSGPKPRTVMCHPIRKHAAHGLCMPCYQTKWRGTRNVK